MFSAGFEGQANGEPQSSAIPELPGHLGADAPAGDGRLIRSNILEFLEYSRVEKGLAANSISSYRRDLNKFAAYLDQRGLTPQTAKREDIRHYLATLYKDGLSAR
ncbi:MAG: site-specific integrase, partial [Terriglobia bacterium]